MSPVEGVVAAPDVIFDNVDATVIPPSPETSLAADALGGLAERMQRGMDRLRADKTRVFPVPGWEDMRLTARKIPDEERDQGVTTVATVALATQKVEMLDEDGEWHEVPHAWRGVAQLMGDTSLSTTSVIREVLDNSVRLDAFALRLVNWMIGVQGEIEQALGE